MVTSLFAATLVPQPITMSLYTTQIGPDVIVYAEGAFQSGGGAQERRRRRAIQTGRPSKCETDRVECPTLQGRSVCVNTETDIFSESIFLGHVCHTHTPTQTRPVLTPGRLRWLHDGHK